VIIELLLALLIGITVGTFTGLAPGIHINLVASVTLANLSLLAGINPLAIAVFIAAMSITHTFTDFIPSIFFGAPNEDTILSVLPGHRLLMEGKGGEAMLLTLQGSIVALLISLVCVPVYIFALPALQTLMKPIIPYVLLAVSFYIILREKRPVVGFFAFALSGILGFLAFNLPVKDSLLPLLSGLFGVSGILTSISSKSIPKKQEKPKKARLLLPKIKYLYSIAIASIVGPLCSFLPGIGSSHISMISSEIVKHNERQFLFLTGISNTLAMTLSFVAAYVIGKTRTGSAAAIKDLLSTITFSNLVIILVACVLSGICAYFIGKKLSLVANNLVSTVSYMHINFVILGILLIVNLLLTNYLGMIILVTSSALGFWSIRSGARRINLMGSLIVPTVLYYLT
jgi:putative membrane protein